MRTALSAFVALLVLGVAQAASGQAPVVTPTMSGGEIRVLGFSDRQVGYFDTATYRRTGDVATIVALNAYADAHQPRPGVRYTELTLDFECSTHRFKVTAYKAFDVEGRLMDTAGAWPTSIAIADGSPAGFMYPVVCTAGGLQSGQVITGDYKADARVRLATPPAR